MGVLRLVTDEERPLALPSVSALAAEAALALRRFNSAADPDDPLKRVAGQMANALELREIRTGGDR
jgi:hypothetical protein